MAGQGPPPRYCDLVAKGGVTSGIVYPAAIAKLSAVFQFRNLGGTSVGAIAAACAAAAEYGRVTGGRNNFDRIRDLPGWLGEPSENGRTHLFNLFQPSLRTRKLFAILAAGLDGRQAGDESASSAQGRKGVLRTVLNVLLRSASEFWLVTAVALLAGGAVSWAAALHFAEQTSGGTLLAGTVAIGMTLVLTGAALATAFLFHAGRQIPANCYGLCKGLRTRPSDPQALSEWLTDLLDQLANLPKGSSPLTFGNLWWPDVASGSTPSDYDPEDRNTAEQIERRRINLEMISTCITEGRPYRLPFRQDFDVRENRRFWYRPEDLRQFLPHRVVQWMQDHPRASSRFEEMAAQGFWPFPDPWNVPVVLAVRMSLSFPILMSAIPLYIAGSKDTPDLCWFSDGGICSNFPIHFFDAPIPQWPTFALNLSEKANRHQTDVWMLEEMSQGASATNVNLEYSYGQDALRRADTSDRRPCLSTLAAFIKAILFTMHNWNDSTQTVLPGNRDRIVLVRMGPGEGGLNLNMPKPIIDEISRRGDRAAEMLIERYGGEPHELGWDNHRWVRFRAMLAATEEYLVKLERSCSALEENREKVEDWIRTGAGKYYQWNADQIDTAIQTVVQLRAIAARWLATRPLAVDAPRPRAEHRLRVRL